MGATALSTIAAVLFVVADWWQCCVANNFVPSKACPPPECGKLSAGTKDCCTYKGGWGQDKTCPYTPDSPPRVCESLGSDDWWACCAHKNTVYLAFGDDPSCPPPSCGKLSAEGKKGCCTHKGPSQDPTCAADYQPPSSGTVSKTDIGDGTEAAGAPEATCYGKNETMAAVVTILNGIKAEIEAATTDTDKVNIAVAALDSIKAVFENSPAWS
ncbi:hypothetical protein N2152v2_010977 [Parachlorella kessleri]